jgi:hypothetical protein
MMATPILATHVPARTKLALLVIRTSRSPIRYPALDVGLQPPKRSKPEAFGLRKLAAIQEAAQCRASQARPIEHSGQAQDPAGQCWQRRLTTRHSAYSLSAFGRLLRRQLEIVEAGAEG